MMRFVSRLLRLVGVLDFDLLTTTAASFPPEEQMRPGDLVHVVDGGTSKWACLRCPGGCGAVIPLSLNQGRRPRWAVTSDRLGRPTVKPSVHQQNACGCHFWITDGKVNWCEGGRPTVGTAAEYRGGP